MKAVNIQWDTDEPEESERLPDEMEIPENITDTGEIFDYFTDQTGFCYKGFELSE